MAWEPPIYTTTYYIINSVSSVFTLKFQKEKVHFKYLDDALK